MGLAGVGKTARAVRILPQRGGRVGSIGWYSAGLEGAGPGDVPAAAGVAVIVVADVPNTDIVLVAGERGSEGAVSVCEVWSPN